MLVIYESQLRGSWPSIEVSNRAMNKPALAYACSLASRCMPASWRLTDKLVGFRLSPYHTQGSSGCTLNWVRQDDTSTRSLIETRRTSSILSHKGTSQNSQASHTRNPDPSHLKVITNTCYSLTLFQNSNPCLHQQHTHTFSCCKTIVFVKRVV